MYTRLDSASISAGCWRGLHSVAAINCSSDTVLVGRHTQEHAADPALASVTATVSYTATEGTLIAYQLVILSANLAGTPTAAAAVLCHHCKAQPARQLQQ